MTGTAEDDGLRERVQARGEQAIGDLAQALLENPMFSGALGAAFGAREKALEAQHAAMGALNLPTAGEVERLERRLRSVSERLETVEDQLDRMARDLGEIRSRLAAEATVPADQASLRVED
jgi:chromosome segregation ATPase